MGTVDRIILVECSYLPEILKLRVPVIASNYATEQIAGLPNMASDRGWMFGSLVPGVPEGAVKLLMVPKPALVKGSELSLDFVKPLADALFVAAVAGRVALVELLSDEEARVVRVSE